ncbi:PIN domain-containing protein [Azospirillum canadense]|uniref:PIN domain-containing protein n=1 Tax=Azospirillum canadense TaxID=403962 RepID=UPI00222780CE|nr:PIN domain-containing protein [Azospirillum canadense]MCW2239338.1 putative nucleic acid-binding protein [Azospirillum canadense]
MIILDTNVLSELMRPNPSAAVVRWIAGQTATDLCTTAVTQAEILYGLVLLPEGKRRNDLLTAAGQMFAEDFAGRVLPFDGAAAEAFALLAAGRRRAGASDRNLRRADCRHCAVARCRRGDPERGGFSGLRRDGGQPLGRMIVRERSAGDRDVQRFGSPRPAQRFVSLQSAAFNTFNVQRHPISRRTVRAQGMADWRSPVVAA